MHPLNNVKWNHSKRFISFERLWESGIVVGGSYSGSPED